MQAELTNIPDTPSVIHLELVNGSPPPQPFDSLNIPSPLPTRSLQSGINYRYISSTREWPKIVDREFSNKYTIGASPLAEYVYYYGLEMFRQLKHGAGGKYVEERTDYRPKNQRGFPQGNLAHPLLSLYVGRREQPCLQSFGDLGL